MKPTDICLRSECREENCLRSWISEPLPNELVIEAWKARVGKSFDRERTQAACCLRCQKLPRRAWMQNNVRVWCKIRYNVVRKTERYVWIITKKTTTKPSLKTEVDFNSKTKQYQTLYDMFFKTKTVSTWGRLQRQAARMDSIYQGCNRLTSIERRIEHAEVDLT